MTCKQCGAEVTADQRFCASCGAPQEPAAQPQPAPNPVQPAPASNQDSMGQVLKIVAGIGAAIFAIRAVASLIGLFRGLISFVFRFLDYGLYFWVIVDFLQGPVMGVLFTAANAVICVALLCFLLRKDEHDSEPLLLGLGAGGVLLILAQVLQVMIGSVFALINGYFIHVIGTYFLNVVGAVLWGALPTVVIFLLLHLMGKTPFKGKSADEIKAAARAVLPTAMAVFKSKKAERPAPRPAPQPSAAPQAQPVHNQPAGGSVVPVSTARTPLKTDRGLVMYILLTIVTCGIYGYYFLYSMARDVNIVCEGDGQKTGGLAAFILLSIITCGIYALFWYYNLGNRLAANAPRYGLSFQENGTTVLLWYLVGALLCGIGPYVAMHFLMKNTNAICMAYNRANGLV